MREIAKRISLRLDSAEYEHLKQLSADTGLKMEPVLRRLIVGAELRPPSARRTAGAATPAFRHGGQYQSDRQGGQCPRICPHGGHRPH